MKSIFIIIYFSKDSYKYLGTINAGFETKEEANNYLKDCDNERFIYAINEIPLYKYYK